MKNNFKDASEIPLTNENLLGFQGGATELHKPYETRKKTKRKALENKELIDCSEAADAKQPQKNNICPMYN